MGGTVISNLYFVRSTFVQFTFGYGLRLPPCVPGVWIPSSVASTVLAIGRLTTAMTARWSEVLKDNSWTFGGCADGMDLVNK